MVAFINPFDFKRIIMEFFLGGASLFPFLFIIIVSSASAYFRMPKAIFTVLLVFGSLIFSTVLGGEIYIFVLLIFGLTSFWTISKMTN